MKKRAHGRFLVNLGSMMLQRSFHANAFVLRRAALPRASVGGSGSRDGSAPGAFRFEAVEVHADVGGFGGGVGQPDGVAEGDPGFRVAPQLQQQPAAHAVEVEVAAQRLLQRFDQGQRLLRAPRTFDTATARLRVITGEACSRSSVA
jgi:hypothetical protein